MYRLKKNEKLVTYAKQIILDSETQIKAPRPNLINLRSLTIIFSLIIIVILGAILLFYNPPKPTPAPTQTENIISSTQTQVTPPKNPQTNLDKPVTQAPAVSKIPELTLATSNEIDLAPLKTMGEVTPIQQKIKLAFSPYVRKPIKTIVTATQATTSNGMKISEKKVSFVMLKKITGKAKNLIIVKAIISQVKGNTSPTMLGFPKANEEVTMEIGPDFSVKNVYSKTKPKGKVNSDGGFVLPFPRFDTNPIDSSSTWGSNIKQDNFAINVQYKVNGLITHKGKQLLELSFLSTSASLSQGALFFVDRKGLFYVEKDSGLPVYLKLKTVSKTKLNDTGFPIENTITIEETAL